MAEHLLKVVPPYFDALVSGAKTFEVRRNDRAYQRGDIMHLREWHPERTGTLDHCDHPGCEHWGDAPGHWATDDVIIERQVMFVFSGDPRFGGVEPGYVVLGLGPVTPS